MNTEYDLRWKAARGYYDTQPSFRWLSDEECDHWERLRREWLETTPYWTTRKPDEGVSMKLVLLPAEHGFTYQWPLPAEEAEKIAAALDVKTVDCGRVQDAWGLEAHFKGGLDAPVYRSDRMMRRAFGLLNVFERRALDKDEIEERVDMQVLVREYGVDLGTSSRLRVFKCPFHDDAAPSFSIDYRKKLWHCFGCGIGGDCFSFVMRKEGCTFIEALRILNQMF